DGERPSLGYGEYGFEDNVAKRAEARRVIAVGGGRGGGGKSLVAVNLAVYFAQLGKSVVLVDADPTGSNLHAPPGPRAAATEPPLDENTYEASFKQALVATRVPGLSHLPAAHDAVSASPGVRGSRKARWMTRLRALPADFVVLDVGPGHGSVAVDLMLA